MSVRSFSPGSYFFPESQLILQGTGIIQPTGVLSVVRKGETFGSGCNASQGFSRMNQIWYDSNNTEYPFTMYAVDLQYTSITDWRMYRYSDQTQTVVDSTFGENSGDEKLHKYISSDGITWIETDDSPQSIWIEIGGVPVEAAGVMGFWPIPYCKGVFNAPDESIVEEVYSPM